MWAGCCGEVVVVVAAASATLALAASQFVEDRSSGEGIKVMRKIARSKRGTGETKRKRPCCMQEMIPKMIEAGTDSWLGFAAFSLCRGGLSSSRSEQFRGYA